MMCGSAFKNKGVQPLLDAVVDFLPSPADREAFKGIDPKTGEPALRRPIDEDPLSLLAFKIMSFEHVGSITFCRIYSGKLAERHGAANTTRDKKERVGRMYLMHAADREEIKEAYAGDIVALLGPQGHAHRRDAVAIRNKPVLLEKMDFPNPVIEMKIEPKTKADQEKMSMALSHAWRSRIPPSASRSITSPARRSSRAWASFISTSRSTSCAAPTASMPTSARRRSPTARRSRAPTEIDYTHKKQTGGTGQFARVKLRLEPNETGKGNEFESEVVGGTVPKEYIPGVEKGINSVWDNGVLIGFPMVDMKVTLYDGAFHEVDSSAIAFEIAVAFGDEGRLRQGRREAARADHGRRGGDARATSSAASSATSTAGAARSARRRCAATPP